MCTPYALTIEIMAIIAIEIKPICAPIGRPLVTSARRITRSGLKRPISCRLIHSGCWRARSHSSMSVNPIALATSVASAEPVIPIFGIGPQPKINRGLSTVSRMTTSSRNQNGVRVSPAPRSTAETKASR